MCFLYTSTSRFFCGGLLEQYFNILKKKELCYLFYIVVVACMHAHYLIKTGLTSQGKRVISITHHKFGVNITNITLIKINFFTF